MAGKLSGATEISSSDSDHMAPNVSNIILYQIVQQLNPLKLNFKRTKNIST